MKLIARKYSWLDSIRIPFQCCPIPIVLRILVVLIAHLSPTVRIFATAMFIDRALLLFNGRTTWHSLLFPIFLLGGLIIYDHLNNVFSNMCNQSISNGLRLEYVTALTTKCAMLYYTEIENHETWNLIKRVKRNPDETMQKGLDSVFNLAGICIQLAGFLSVLFLHVWWVVILAVVIAVPTIFLGMKGGKKQYEAQREVTTYERRCEYVEEVLTARDAVDERSLFGYSDYFQKQWKGLYKKSRRAELTVIAKSLIRMKSISSVMIVITFFIAFALLYPVSQNIISVGLFISLIQAANSVVDTMSWTLSDNISAFTKYKEYLKDLTAFVGLPENKEALELPTEISLTLHEIEFVDVTFCYPGTQKAVLQHLNLKLKEGQHYAIVGGNGAGKTTLIKLLSGLYTDFQGDILINGCSIRDYPLSELKSLMAILFQDFARYDVTFHDNIALGDILHFGSSEQDNRILSAVEQIGLSTIACHLPEGLDTPLGKLFAGGQDLSGGQWQRVAMARTVISLAPLLILDEPTAALDPMSESNLYKKFEEISRGKTTLFISHRLGSTMLADKILVLNEGKIIEQGTHDELMTEGGLYQEMYESQRSWYQ